MLVYGIFWNYSARIHIRVGPQAYHFLVTVFYFCWKLQMFEAKLKSWQTWCCRFFLRFSCFCWDKITAQRTGPSSTRHTKKEVGIQWHLCVRDGPRHSTSLGLGVCWRVSGWWFQTFFISTPGWGRFPIWLIFFKWVETTNQVGIDSMDFRGLFGCWIVLLVGVGSFAGETDTL